MPANRVPVNSETQERDAAASSTEGAATPSSAAETSSAEESREQDAGQETAREQKSPDEKSPRESIHAARRRLDELAEFVRHYLDAQLDSLKLTARKTAVYGLAGVVALIVAIVVIATAAVLLCIGLSGALSALFRARPWVGQLLTGLIILTSVALGGCIAYTRIMRSSRERTVKKYAARKQRQRANFGEDVDSAPHA